MHGLCYLCTMVYWLFVCRIRRLNLFAILRCRWLERHFERAGQFVRDHTAIACHYMSHFAEAAATSRMQQHKYRACAFRLDSFYFWVKLEWMPMVYVYSSAYMCKYIYLLRLRYGKIIYDILIVWAFYLNIGNTCHWRFYTYFSRRRVGNEHIFLHILKFQWETSAKSRPKCWFY